MEWYLKRDAQGKHEVAVKLTCSAGETDRLKKKWRLFGQETNMRQKRRHEGKEKETEISEGMGASQRSLQAIYCGLFPGSITASCLPSRLIENDRSNFMYAPCTQYRT